jgi:hypothetical protein
MQMKRCGRFKCRDTIECRRFGYSGPNFVPHRMQITLTMLAGYRKATLSTANTR